MLDVRQSISKVMDQCSLEQVSEVTLTNLQADSLEPEVVHQIRHMSLVERAKKMKKFVPLELEPDFVI